MPWANDAESRARTNRLYGAAWRRARLDCLRRANWRCEIKLPGCQGAATEVDHIDGIDNDPHHRRLRAGCHSCHGKRTAQQGGGYRTSPGRRSPADPRPETRTAW